MFSKIRTAPNYAYYVNKGTPDLFLKAQTAKYTLDDWATNNNLKFRIMNDQAKLKEKLQEESKRTIDEVNETTKKCQDQVEYHTKERIAEVNFLSDELKKQKKNVLLEIEALNVFLERIKAAIDFLHEKALRICQQCLTWREGRIGLEFCEDEVDLELRRELKTIKGCQQLLDKTFKESTEQLRRLRATMVLLDFDIEGKEKAKMIDEKNNTLKQANTFLGSGVDITRWHCHHSLVDWCEKTNFNLKNNAMELASATNMRSCIEMLLKQICEDMRNQTDRTNKAYERRIYEMKSVIKMLEEKHKKTLNNAQDLKFDTIKKLENEIIDKERAILLCKTRLSNRTYRPGIERTCDYVHESLYLELNSLEATMCKLKQKLTENEALLRYTLHVQMMQEEEINLKLNNIKIDECDCMPLRQALVYTRF